jgi:hypothetical protein
MRLNNLGAIQEKLAGLKQASFLNSKTALAQDDYVISLSEDADFQITQFITNAILVSQYAKYQNLRASGESPNDSLVMALATNGEQELAYELINMAKLHNIIGGTMLIGTACPSIQVVTVANARAFEITLNKNFCIPADAEEDDKWLMSFLEPTELLDWIKDRITDGNLTDELKQLIKDLISIGQLTDELKQWLIDHIDEPGVVEVIQDLINTGGIKDGNGRPIIIPDLPPPAASTGPGSPGITKATTGGVTYTKVCGVPQQIAHKDLTGIRSILVFANLIPVEIGPLKLRGAVDSFARFTFDKYKPRNLVSATFELVGTATKQLVAEIPPAPPVTANYTNAPALAHNGVVDVIASNSTKVLGFNLPIDGVNVGEQLTLEYFAGPGSQKTIGSRAAPLRCSEITFQGLVTPVPVLVQAIDFALNNKSGLDLYLTCLEIRSSSPIEYDVPFLKSVVGVPSYNSNNLRDNVGIIYSTSSADTYFRNNNQGNFGVGFVGSLQPNTGYIAKFRAGAIGFAPGTLGQQSNYIKIHPGGDYFQNTTLYQSPTVVSEQIQGKLMEIPFTTPATIDPCETYFISFNCSYPDVFYYEIGIS